MYRIHPVVTCINSLFPLSDDRIVRLKVWDNFGFELIHLFLRPITWEWDWVVESHTMSKHMNMYVYAMGWTFWNLCVLIWNSSLSMYCLHWYDLLFVVSSCWITVVLSIHSIFNYSASHYWSCHYSFTTVQWRAFSLWSYYTCFL